MSFFLAFPLFAERIYLRDGSVISGTILSRSSQELVVKGLSGIITIRTEDVVKIDKAATEKRAVAVQLKDGSVLFGTIEEQDSTILVLSTQAGLINLRQSVIDRIMPRNSYTPGAGTPSGAGLLRAGLRGGAWALSGPVRSNYRSGSGGTIFLESAPSGSETFFGIESRFGRFLSTDNRGDQLDLAMLHALLGYNFSFGGGLLLLSPRLGLGGTALRNIRLRREVEYISLDYFQQKDDYVGLALLSQDLRQKNYRLMALMHFLNKDDRVGYVLADRTIFREERSGFGVSGLISLVGLINFKNGLNIGMEAFAAGVGESGGGIPMGGVQLEIGWRI